MQFSIKTLSVLALATSVIAMPAHPEKGSLLKRQWRGGNRFWQRPDTTAVITVTGYDSEATLPTAMPTASAYTTTSTSVYSAPAAPTYTQEAPEAPWTPESTPTPTPAASASPSPSPAAGSSSDNTGYMSIVSKYRAAGGLPALTQDSLLESNAMKTSVNSVGGLIHELNPGTFAQVLAPGTPDNFESVYVGGWLCEIPTLPGLNGICATLAQGWNHDGQTGHAEILTSTAYTKIGCALASSTGVWACDLA